MQGLNARSLSFSIPNVNISNRSHAIIVHCGFNAPFFSLSASFGLLLSGRSLKVAFFVSSIEGKPVRGTQSRRL